MKLINRLQAVELIQSTSGQIFTAKFIKKDNTTRIMNCRLEVLKRVKGVGLSYDPYKYGLLSVYDVQIGEFRMLNVSTLKQLVVRGEEYLVK